MSTPRRIIIIGGGTAGTITANRLRRELPRERAEITVIDATPDHLYQPGLLFVPFSSHDGDHLSRPRVAQLHDGVNYLEHAVERVDVEQDRVELADGSTLGYDALVIASGASLMPEETEGLTAGGWNENVFTFYTQEGARALRKRLRTFSGGRIAVNIVDMPIKCPVAPLEFTFLLDEHLHHASVRDDVQVTYVTPLDGAFTKPVCSRELGHMLDDKGVSLVTEFNTGTVDGEAGKLIGYDGREVEFDLAVVVPLHGGAAYVGRSEGLGDELGWIPTDQHTLQSRVRPNIFAIGDAANIPTSKAGSAAHFQSEVLVENIVSFLAGEGLDASYDGHVNCFIESGFGKALLIDFNYETEPLPGHYPTQLGIPLLRESHLAHAGKLMFEQVYWHALLPGRDIPGIHPAMPLAGKVREPAATTR